MAEIKGGKVICRSFGTTDHLGASVLFQKDFRRTEFTIVIVTHGKAVGSRIMDNNQVSDINLRQFPVNGKFIIILAKRTCHIIYVIAWGIFFTGHCDMMIRTLHGRTHQIAGTGIQTDIFFVNMFFMNRSCN